MSLPVLSPSAESPCFGCATPCCFEYEVPVSGFDVWRLCRTMQTPWTAVARVKREVVAETGSFRLDSTANSHTLWMRKKPNGACSLLLELPGQQHRCGAHDGRPLACRAYPMRRLPGPPTAEFALGFIDHAMCPGPQRRAWELGRLAMVPSVEGEHFEKELYVRLSRRWNEMAMLVPRNQTMEPDEYLAWVFEVYDRLQPLRNVDGAAWPAVATAFIDGVALPTPVSIGY